MTLPHNCHLRVLAFVGRRSIPKNVSVGLLLEAAIKGTKSSEISELITKINTVMT